MRVDAEEAERYDTLEEAQDVVESLKAMNPEDIYQIEVI